MGCYALRTEYWAGLRPIEVRMDGEVEKLERVQDEHKSGLAWSFIEVEIPNSVCAGREMRV